MARERWKDVVGFEGIYMVSDRGRVWSAPRAPSRIIGGRGHPGGYKKPSISIYGYPSVALSDKRSGKARRCCVHILVLEAFAGPRPPGMDASHLDGNRANPRLSNLVWETKSANHLRKRGHGTMLRGEKAPWSKLKERDVIEMRRLVRTGAETCSEIVRRRGLPFNTVWKAITGRTWAHVSDGHGAQS